MELQGLQVRKLWWLLSAAKLYGVADGVKLVEGDTTNPHRMFVTVRNLWISLRRYAGFPLALFVGAEVFRGQRPCTVIVRLCTNKIALKFT